jgi:hypothetical protein
VFSPLAPISFQFISEWTVRVIIDEENMYCSAVDCFCLDLTGIPAENLISDSIVCDSWRFLRNAWEFESEKNPDNPKCERFYLEI